MATVNLNHVRFWQPPSNPSFHKQRTAPLLEICQRHCTTKPTQPSSAQTNPSVQLQRLGTQDVTLKPRDFEAQAEDEGVGAQGRNHDPTNRDDETDDSLPSIEEILGPLLRKEIAATGCQGTRDRPVILEDVEDGCFVYEDLHPLPSLEHEGLASTPAQDQPHSRRHSLGLSQDQTNPHGDNRTTRSASEEPAPQSLLTTLDEDGGGGSEGNVSDLKRDMQLAFEGQEELLATSPSSPRPRRSAESSHPQIDQDRNQSRSEELRSGSRLYSQDEEQDGPREQQEQEEVAVDDMRHEVVEEELEEGDDGDNNGEREQRGEKRQHQDEGSIAASAIRRAASIVVHRRRGRREPTTCEAAEIPHSVTPSSTTQLEIGDAQSQTGHAHPPTSVNNDHHYTPLTPLTPRSPSDTVESAPVAEYQELPFQGFLKRVTIGDQMTYNLEFSLSHIPEHLNLSLYSEVLSASSRESSTEDALSRRAVTSRKPGKQLTKNQESRLAKIVHEDKTWAEIRRHFPGHTLQSLKENFFTKQGGKPRKRGRKPGVKAGGASIQALPRVVGA
ncbi:hypothetical protein BKA65DRAFT_478089 [Rhexocercosporidium sp. MPI-PUGE-AT-0058]|nr:hypothetical protein BKA65DRAFT_478089 [Rhexocercosporidium sp. MPI-PUGE-AT-0058]